MKKKNKEKNTLKINADFEEVLKVSVKNKPKFKPKKNKKSKK